MKPNASLISALEDFEWPPNAAAELARGAHVVSYGKGSAIFHAGEAADLVYVLLCGEVKLQFNAGIGTSLLVSIARGGQMLGVFAPYTKPSSGAKPEQLFTAQALSHCKVAIMPTARVAQVLNRLPAERLVQILERSREHWTQLSCRLLTFLTMSVRGRLTQTIAEIADTFGVADARGRVISLRLSHEDFAALVGASRPMVSKHLRELASEGVLSKQDGRYVVLLPTQCTSANEEGNGGNGGNGAGSTVSPVRHPADGFGEPPAVSPIKSAAIGTRGKAGGLKEALRVEGKRPLRSI
jgi:CRP/FNR family transcriptional regulator